MIMRAEMIMLALNMAISQRRPAKGWLHHSDRGSQYAGKKYRQQLTELGGVCSMFRKGNCWDNAAVESFFATLKKELLYPRGKFDTRTQAQEEIFKYIETWYNRKRRHSTLGYLSPEEFEQLLSQQLLNAAA